MTDTENIINNISSIQFIFAKPYIEGYYLYGVNTVEEVHILPKEQLRQILTESLQCKDSLKLDYLLTRGFPFLYDNISHQLKQFQYINPEPSQKEVKDELYKNLAQQVTPVRSSPLQQQYNSLFKENLLIKLHR